MNTIPDGLRFVDNEYTPCLIASVSYWQGPGWSSHKLFVLALPLLDDGLADDGLAEDGLAEDGLDRDDLADDGRPKVTDCMLLLLVNIIPLRIASGS